MANTKSAAKRARQSETRATANQAVSSGVKTALKKASAAIASGKKEEASKALQALSSKLDKAAKTGRIHKNKANRQKSKFAKKLAKLA